MSFDPEKAERHTVHDDQVDVLNSHLDVREYVLASDYDQLLSLYRDAVKPPPILCVCGHHKDGHCGPKGVCTAKFQIDKKHPGEWSDCICAQFLASTPEP